VNPGHCVLVSWEVLRASLIAIPNYTVTSPKHAHLHPVKEWIPGNPCLHLMSRFQVPLICSVAHNNYSSHGSSFLMFEKVGCRFWRGCCIGWAIQLRNPTPPPCTTPPPLNVYLSLPRAPSRGPLILPTVAEKGPFFCFRCTFAESLH